MQNYGQDLLRRYTRSVINPPQHPSLEDAVEACENVPIHCNQVKVCTTLNPFTGVASAADLDPRPIQIEKITTSEKG